MEMPCPYGTHAYVYMHACSTLLFRGRAHSIYACTRSWSVPYVTATNNEVNFCKNVVGGLGSIGLDPGRTRQIDRMDHVARVARPALFHLICSHVTTLVRKRLNVYMLVSTRLLSNCKLKCMHGLHIYTHTIGGGRLYLSLPEREKKKTSDIRSER